jgi:hypothetical protein
MLRPTLRTTVSHNPIANTVTLRTFRYSHNRVNFDDGGSIYTQKKECIFEAIISVPDDVAPADLVRSLRNMVITS